LRETALKLAIRGNEINLRFDDVLRPFGETFLVNEIKNQIQKIVKMRKI
jgi:hypothetical protein